MSQSSTSGSPEEKRVSAQSIYLDVEGTSTKQAETLERLARQDWAFADANTQQYAHSIHPYPAKFIPQIPRRLIDALHPKDGSATLDPFCGSGTTLLESVMQGIPAVGVDINPLAVLLSRVKSRPLEQPLDNIARSIADEARELIQNDESYQVPDIPNLDHWFQEHVSEIVSLLVDRIDQAEAGHTVKDALRVALSSILVRVSNQESNTRYAAIEKSVSQEDVVDQFQKAAVKISETLRSVVGSPLFPDLRSTEVKAIQADSRELHKDLPDCNVGLIVTSPPYPNAYEYWLYHKYRMYWLGMDPIAARNNEIGARPFYSKENGLTSEDFARHLSQCFSSFKKLLSTDNYACILVGNSTIRGEKVDNGSIVAKVGEENGFKLRASIPRKIPSKKSSFNPSIGSIRNERVIILQKK